MAKRNSKELDGPGPIVLMPKVGSPHWEALERERGREIVIPRDPELFLYTLTDIDGNEDIRNGAEVDIGDYCYNKGIMHAAVINTGRSIPRIEDGLKAVERRAIYTMYEKKYYGKNETKVQTAVGDMIGMVHPHGDQSAAATIYRIGNHLRMMIPYVKEKGEYGNMVNMRPSAPRYAEAVLTDYIMDCCFGDIGPCGPLYDEIDSYNYKYKEPVYLISRYPNILMQWNLGIGKGAMTWLGAFNSDDMFKATLALMDDPKANIRIYPDTPIPVDIVNKKELKSCFDKKDFKVRMRSPYHIESYERPNSRGVYEKVYALVFTALPLGVIGEHIVDEMKRLKDDDKKSSSKRFSEVLNIEPVVDQDGDGGIKLYVEYQYGYDPNTLAEKLYRSTSLAKTVGVRYYLIFNNHPEYRSPREILLIWINQRYDQKRRYYHQLSVKAAKDRAIYSALATILETKDATDEAIAIIRSSNTDDESVAKLRKRFDFTDFQARNVLEYKLKTLQRMNVKDTIAKRDKAAADYKHYRDLLGSKERIKEAIKEELREGQKKYARKRMARLRNLSVGDIGNPTDTRYVIYNGNSYFCVDKLADLGKVWPKVDSSYRLVEIRNGDDVLIFGSHGEIRIMNGYAFSTNDFGIAIETLGIGDAVSIYPNTGKYNSLVVVTRNGYGKVVEMTEAVKSSKGKIVMLSDGDTLADVIPVDDVDTAAIGMISGDTMYHVKLEDFPIFKRGSAGNRMLKGVTDPNITRICSMNIPMDGESSILIYGDSGYVKLLSSKCLTYNRKGYGTLTLAKRQIMGAAVIHASPGFVDVSFQGAGEPIRCGVTIDNKMIRFDGGKALSAKFKPSTTISAPARLLNAKRGEWYQITEVKE